MGWVMRQTPLSLRRKRLASSSGSSPTTRPSGILTPRSTTTRLSRAPRWMQRLGLEWLWRLGLEPRRLWRRYAVDAWSFPLAVLADLRGAWPGAGRDGDGAGRDGSGR